MGEMKAWRNIVQCQRSRSHASIVQSIKNIRFLRRMSSLESWLYKSLRPKASLGRWAGHPMRGLCTAEVGGGGRERHPDRGAGLDRLPLMPDRTPLGGGPPLRRLRIERLARRFENPLHPLLLSAAPEISARQPL